VHALVVDRAADLEPFVHEWDDLAVASGQPAMAPSWQLAWWRHLAPTGAQARVVVVTEGGRLIGIAPYYSQAPSRGRVDYKPFVAGFTHRLSPLAVAGREREVAGVIAKELAASRPRPDMLVFEAIDAGSRWPEAVAHAWPGPLRPWRYRKAMLNGPVIESGNKDFDRWMSSRSANFRSQMRRGRRNIERAGGAFRMVEHHDDAERVIGAMLRMHHARWDKRGGSGIGAGASDMLADVARELVPSGRLRLWVLEIGEQIACVQAFISAGGNTMHWNGGFDEAWAPHKPAIITIFVGIEDCFRRGDERVDLSAGDPEYKLRFADSNAPASWTGITPRGLRYPLTRASLVNKQIASGAWAFLQPHLSENDRLRLKRLLRR
jgi:CelD/BcsL family acetyltransferase involved in cellulose biosynthesis